MTKMRSAPCSRCGKIMPDARSASCRKCHFELRTRPIMERFWEKVRKTDGCWEWIGRRDTKGYGYFSVGKKDDRAHRFSYKTQVGEIGTLFVCHHCDNPPCVRPDHLFLGTNTDNIRDAAAKHRLPKRNGVANGNAKLNPDQINQIKTIYKAGGISLKKLGDQFGVVPGHVFRIVRGKAWAQ